MFWWQMHTMITFGFLLPSNLISPVHLLQLCAAVALPLSALFGCPRYPRNCSLLTLLASRTLIVTEPVVTVSVCTVCMLSPRVTCGSPLQPQKKSLLHGTDVCLSWEEFLWFSWQTLRQRLESVLLVSQFNLCTNMQ